MPFTLEQTHAIERRKGDMLLDAGAGSGKTTVLVERFARAVEEDGVDVSSILTITFTEKAAAELRDRIRTRLRVGGDAAAARATESAWISTIHGFCARVLRTHALSAGLDPNFTVLDEHQSAELRGRAFDAALTELARDEHGLELVSAYGPRALRAAITRTYAELRARGQLRPRLPAPEARMLAAVGRAAADHAEGRHPHQLHHVAGALPIEDRGAEVLELAVAVHRELSALPDPGRQVLAAIATLERAPRVLGTGLPWPGDLDGLKLPGGNAKALESDACDDYRDALEELRALAAQSHALAARDTLDALLSAYGEHYAALKRARSGLDFEDLELLARELLRNQELGRRYRERFVRVMVDEMQDTNHVQMELIELLAGVDLFMVGDAQQSIYGFRHADVELFEERGRALERTGARASLQTNFRSRPEILAALNGAFERALGERFRPLLPGREDQRLERPLVELLVVDKDAIAAGGDAELDAGGAAAWRVAEARALAARVAQLIGAGEACPGDVVVLTRATTDIAVYERALTSFGLPTYVIGGRGYWQQPQVIQLVCYLRALANPLDREALHTTLLSPFCGLSLDGLVLLEAGAREQLPTADQERLQRFEDWFSSERAAATRLGVEALLDRALAASGYELAVAVLADGRRRLANVRKLMRLAREWEAASGTDLRGLLDMIAARAGGDGATESEAPVAGEALDAVRLMSIHRAKGLEFPVVCVADLGRRQTTAGAGLIAVGRDGRRLGLQIKRPGSGERINALWYDQIRQERRELEAAEERRLFYVAMTRAQERLIVSGAATFNDWEEGNRLAPIGWVGSAFVPDIGRRTLTSATVPGAVGARAGAPPFITELGVEVRFIARMPAPPAGPAARAAGAHPLAAPAPALVTAATPAPPQPAPLSTLSYTALATYEKCGYRFYAEHVLGLPPAPQAAQAPPPRPATAEQPQAPVPAARPAPALTPQQAAARGTRIHAILAGLDFRNPMMPLGTPAEILPLIAQFTASATFARLATLVDVRREQRFAFDFEGTLITGTFDLLARDPRTGGALVIDYKSDHLPDDRVPAQLTREHYAAQRAIYALAALRTGVPGVEVFHIFLERPEEPVVAVYTVKDVPTLELELAERVAGPLAGDFSVTRTPGRLTCAGCPARGGLCSWPAAETWGEG